MFLKKVIREDRYYACSSQQGIPYGPKVRYVLDDGTVVWTSVTGHEYGEVEINLLENLLTNVSRGTDKG